MQDGGSGIEPRHDGIDVGSLRQEKPCGFQPPVSAGEVKGLTENIRTRPLTTKSGLTPRFALEPIGVRQRAGSGLECAIGIEEALHNVQRA